MKDFRRQQFVLVGDTLKLSDVDDIVLGDPKCTLDKDCILEISSGKHVKSYCKYLVYQKCDATIFHTEACIKGVHQALAELEEPSS